jgi:hypothetical protein
MRNKVINDTNKPFEEEEKSESWVERRERDSLYEGMKP